MKPDIVIGSIDPHELSEILQRIDENINMRASLQTAQTENETPIINLPNLNYTAERIDQLYHTRAPFYLIYGSVLKRAALWLINIPLRLFARKQGFHNREALQISTEIVNHSRAMQNELLRLAQQVSNLRSTVNELYNQQKILQQEQQTNRAEQVIQELTEQIQQLTNEQQGLHRWLNQVVIDQRGQHAWLEQIATDQQGIHNWVTILQRKQEMLALDVREGQSERTQESIPEPRILDPERYQQRVEQLGGIRLNLGCGEKPLANYINVDFRPMPDIDIVADVRSLPYQPGSVDEIASAHLVEHFRQHQLQTQIIPYWKSLLKPGGCVRIICPNWEVIVSHLQQGRLTWEQFKLLTFGGQDYIGDDHFAMYTPQTMSSLLKIAGFQQIEIVTSDRMNGICPEMELVAYATV
jgi:predicted SAM-dependent methyltransferase